MQDSNFTTQSSFLHHGIEGQKWGVRNGPPYPLDRDNAKRIVRERKEKLERAEKDLNRTTIKKRIFKGGALGTIIGSSAALADASIGGISNKYYKIGYHGSAIDIPLSSVIMATITPTIGRLIGRYGASSKSKVEYRQAINEVKKANREIKLAEKYTKLALQRRRLTNSEYEKLAELKKELNLD